MSTDPNLIPDLQQFAMAEHCFGRSHAGIASMHEDAVEVRLLVQSSGIDFERIADSPKGSIRIIAKTQPASWVVTRPNPGEPPWESLTRLAHSQQINTKGDTSRIGTGVEVGDGCRHVRSNLRNLRSRNPTISIFFGFVRSGFDIQIGEGI